MNELLYTVTVAPLSKEDGGGYLATVPDLPGCMSDGETPEEALANVRDAIEVWIEGVHDLGRAVPAPSVHKVAGK
jgi:predicted RNase H-like HicB family nuclease